MWNFFKVLMWGPFLWSCSGCMMLGMDPKEWLFSVRCLEKARRIWIQSEGCLMFFETCGEPPASLSDVRSVAIWAGEFVYP